jgi:hypothetical protein
MKKTRSKKSRDTVPLNDEVKTQTCKYLKSKCSELFLESGAVMLVDKPVVLLTRLNKKTYQSKQTEK